MSNYFDHLLSFPTRHRESRGFSATAGLLVDNDSGCYHVSKAYRSTVLGVECGEILLKETRPVAVDSVDHVVVAAAAGGVHVS